MLADTQTNRQTGILTSDILIVVSGRNKRESVLPLTDPRDAEAQRMLNIPYRIIW